MDNYQLPLDPYLLSSFMAVAELQKVSSAARALHLSQPAVTAHIRRLEASLKAPLFLRSVRGVRLTAEGRRLYDYARRIRTLIEEAAQNTAGGIEPSGQLELAASTTIASYVLPGILGAFGRRYPDTSVKLEVGNTEEVIKQVKSGRVPLGLVEGFSKAAHLRLEPFLDDEIVAIASPEMARRIQKPSDLEGLPILWRERGSGTRAVVERALKKAGLTRRKPDHDSILGGTEPIKGAVMAGLGVGFVSRWSIQNELALGKILQVQLHDFRIKRTFAWALPTGALSGLAELFFTFAKTGSQRILLG